MSYVDGYVLPVPKKNIKAYIKMAKKAERLWRKCGALDYKECVGDDLHIKPLMPFLKGIRAKPGETAVFAYIVYKSRKHRDTVNAKVMKDPRMNTMCDPNDIPFDCKRMLYGGFKAVVEI